MKELIYKVKRNCFNCSHFPYSSCCNSCNFYKLNNWEKGSKDYKPAFMTYTRYIPD